MSGAVETLRQNIAALNVTSTVGAEVAREVQGNYRGEAVANSSEASKLQDAAEELGMSVAHRADRRSLDRREVRQGQAASLAALARIADYYDKLPDMPDEDKLRVLVENLRHFSDMLEGSSGGGQRGGVTKQDILAQLQAFASDVTHQYAGLDIAREFFSAAGANQQFQLLLDEAYSEFEKGDLARDVRAGLAVTQAMAEGQATLETDPAAVRDTYRQMLRESRNMGQLFDALRGFDVMRNFSDVVDTFMAAAGKDLASTGPSSDPLYLGALISELSKLKKMQSVIDMSAQLVTETDRLLVTGETGAGGPVDVAASILTFASNAAPSPLDARKMLERYQNCSLSTQLAFANGLRGVHGEIPDDVIPSTQARLQQNTSILAMLDVLVADEENEYRQMQDMS